MKFYRYQHTQHLENDPSLHLCEQVELDRPASDEGWDGYWWAWIRDYDGRVVYGEDYLIKAEDVPAAKAGEQVDVYLPGLCGTDSLAGLWYYVREQVGGIDDDAYVAVYEGELIDAVWDGVVFVPNRLVAVYPATELERLAKEEEE